MGDILRQKETAARDASQLKVSQLIRLAGNFFHTVHVSSEQPLGAPSQIAWIACL